jgi:hypothetical protein
MGLIREPLDVDFFFDPRPLTKQEEREISEFIRQDKLKNAQPQTAVKRPIQTLRRTTQRKKELA